MLEVPGPGLCLSLPGQVMQNSLDYQKHRRNGKYPNFFGIFLAGLRHPGWKLFATLGMNPNDLYIVLMRYCGALFDFYTLLVLRQSRYDEPVVFVARAPPSLVQIWPFVRCVIE